MLRESIPWSRQARTREAFAVLWVHLGVACLSTPPRPATESLDAESVSSQSDARATGHSLDASTSDGASHTDVDREDAIPSRDADPSDSSGVDTRDAAADLDAGTTDSGPADSGSSDSGSIDAGRSDFGPDDLARSDSEPADSSAPDSGARDSGPADSRPADSGRIDSGLMDSGLQDSGSVDAAPRDTGAFDSGSVDAAPLDASGAPDSGAADAGSFTSAPLTTLWVGDRFRVESTAFRVSFDRNRGGSVVELRAASSANLVHEATERRRFAGVAFADCWFSAEVPSANVTFTVLVANPVIV
ncbi:MAG: hypothetical protein HYV07_20945, partial [Deltaproteobacteria bacterium]|nr:hypothetical protein [Deltaproteobacteria bacterium]